MSENIAIIVVRKGSKRIKDKNYQTIGDETLLERKIRQLKNTPSIDTVIVGSDDFELEKKVNSLRCLFYLREEKYCDEISSTVNDMVRNMLSKFYAKPDANIIWAHATNPGIESEDYSEAIKMYDIQKEFGYDSLFSVNELSGHFWNGDSIPLNYSPMCPVHIVAKDLPKIYAQNGGIFIRKYKDMKKDGSFIGKVPYMFKMNSITGLDIDNEEDLIYARALHEKGILKWK